MPDYVSLNDLKHLKQKFTGYERDMETGLDYAQARYFSSTQGRFTSPDPLLASGRAVRPQTWNRYTYALNNPLRFTDPSGLSPTANITPKYQSDDHVEQQRQQQRQVSQAEYNEAWIRYRFERASDGYLDDSVDLAASMPMASVSSSESEPDVKERVMFMEARLVADDTNRRADFDNNNRATLNIETETFGPDVWRKEVFTIRVTFNLPKSAKDCCNSEATTNVNLGKDNMFKLDNKKGDNGSTFWEDNGRRGVDITLRLRDIEARNNRIVINVGGTFKSGDAFSGVGFLRLVGKR